MSGPRLAPPRRQPPVPRYVPLSKPTPPTPSRVAVSRELPPSKLALRIGPRGAGARWAEDEPKAENVLSDIELSDEMPGGFKDLTGTLGRNPQINWADLIAYGDAYAYLPGVQKVWQGSIDKTPDVSGDQMSITPALLGYQAILEDNMAAQFGGINADMSAWGEMSNSRRASLLKGGVRTTPDVGQGFKDAGAIGPGINIDFTNVETIAGVPFRGESWFWGQGITLGRLLYHFQVLGGPEVNAQFNDAAQANSDDIGTLFQVSTDFNATTNASQFETFNLPSYTKYLNFLSEYNDVSSGTKMSDTHGWLWPKVLGNHGLELKGTWPEVGLSAKSMLEYIIPLLANPLTVDSEYIDDDGYVIPHAWYGDQTGVADIIKDILKYGLYDWFVYTDKRFELRKPGSYGKYWKAYVGPSQLNEVGIDSQRLWRSIVVSYQDVDGSTKTVGPIGSGATVETSSLEITDPEHPAVKAERTRRDILDLQGIGVPSTAIAVGKRFLEEANLINRSGSATLQGYVMDQYGVFWPAACVKSGDWISFIDAADRGYRKIINKTYRHSERSAEIDLDAPASGLEALLERLQAGLIGLGVS